MTNLQEIELLKSEMYKLCKYCRSKGEWENEEVENRYYTAQREMNKLRDDELKKNINESKKIKHEKSAHQIMTEKAAIRESIVTSTTYERAQKRLFREVDGFLSGK